MPCEPAAWYAIVQVAVPADSGRALHEAIAVEPSKSSTAPDDL